MLCIVGCSNIADFNTGVSLHSFPVLNESARYFVGDFAICSIQVLCFDQAEVVCQFTANSTAANSTG